MWPDPLPAAWRMGTLRDVFWACELAQPAGGWLTTGEACERAGTTQRALYRVIDEGLLPAYRFGRRIRLRAADVDEYRRRREAGG